MILCECSVIIIIHGTSRKSTDCGNIHKFFPLHTDQTSDQWTVRNSLKSNTACVGLRRSQNSPMNLFLLSQKRYFIMNTERLPSGVYSLGTVNGAPVPNLPYVIFVGEGGAYPRISKSRPSIVQTTMMKLVISEFEKKLVRCHKPDPAHFWKQ